MRSRLLAALLSLALPSCAFPQTALNQLRGLEDAPSSSERAFDGSLAVKEAPSTGVVAGGGGKKASALSEPTRDSKGEKEEPPNPFQPPKPKDGDPRASAGGLKGGIIGGLFSALIGAGAGWAIAVGAGATGGVLAAVIVGAALLFGAAGAAIGRDVGRHCAVDPQCG